jgi:hypothetical protein
MSFSWILGPRNSSRVHEYSHHRGMGLQLTQQFRFKFIAWLSVAKCQQRSLPPFAERVLRNIGSRLPRHSGLMLAARITLPHFSVSSAMSLAKSAGESASTSPPRSASRALILGSARPALISLLSLSTISAGVFLGARSSSPMVS